MCREHIKNIHSLCTYILIMSGVKRMIDELLVTMYVLVCYETAFLDTLTCEVISNYLKSIPTILYH